MPQAWLIPEMRHRLVTLSLSQQISVGNFKGDADGFGQMTADILYSIFEFSLPLQCF